MRLRKSERRRKLRARRKRRSFRRAWLRSLVSLGLEKACLLPENREFPEYNRRMKWKRLQRYVSKVTYLPASDLWWRRVAGSPREIEVMYGRRNPMTLAWLYRCRGRSFREIYWLISRSDRNPQSLQISDLSKLRKLGRLFRQLYRSGLNNRKW